MPTAPLDAPAPATVVVPRAKNDHWEILKLLLPLAVGKAIILLAVYLSGHAGSSFVQNMSTAWDGGIYQSIAKVGYPGTQNSQYLFAFSPLYPILIRGFESLLGSYPVASLAVSNLFGFIFPVVMLKLFDFRTALLAELFPTFLVFSTVGYSDSIAVVFVALTLLLFLRKKYFSSGVALGIAVVDFYNLAIMFPAFCIRAILDRTSPVLKSVVKLAIPVAIAASGIALFYQFSTGSLFTYFNLEKGTWGVSFVTPLAQAEWILNVNGQGWFSNQGWQVLGIYLAPSYWLIRNYLFEAFYFVGVYLLLRSRHPQKWLLGACSLIVLLPLLFLGGMAAISIPRLMLPAFPIFYGYSSQVINRRGTIVAYAVVCVVLSVWTVLSVVLAFFA